MDSNFPCHVTLEQIQFNGRLSGYRADHGSYREAAESLSVYENNSTLDALDLNESKSGFYDLLEVIELQQRITGYGDIVMGMVVTTPQGKLFIGLELIVAMLFRWGDDIKLVEMVNVAIEMLNSEFYVKQHFSVHIWAEMSMLLCLNVSR